MGSGTREGVVTGERGGETGWLTVVRVDAKAWKGVREGCEWRKEDEISRWKS